MNKIKVLLLAFLIALPALRIDAETFTLGSCDHKIASTNGYGSDTAGEIAAALFIPSSRLKTLAGNKITRIDVGLISRINVREVTVWVRKSLTGDNLASGNIERGKLGWNEVILEKPYTIEEDCPGLYIGFNYANTGSSHPVSFIGDCGDYTSWLKTSAGSAWEDMTSKGSLSIEAIVSGESLPKYNLALVSGEISPDPSNGDNSYLVSGTVTNLAVRNITGFRLAVKDGEVTVGATDIRLDVAPGAKASFSAPVQADKRLSGEVTLTIESVFEGEDVDMSDNSLPARVEFTRNVLIEEFTTENCPNCPEGARMVHSVLDSDPLYSVHVVPVCHHSSVGTDWLTRDCDAELLWMYGSSGQVYAPAAMFNRNPTFKKGLTMEKEEPIVALRSEKDIESCIKTCLEVPAHAMIGIQVGDIVETGEESTVEVSVTVLTDAEFAMAYPTLTFYTIEDNIKARYQEGAGTDYIHQHVIRTDNGTWGEPISFTDGSWKKSFTVTIDPTWKKADLSFVAFIANHDSENVNDNLVENVSSAPLKKVSVPSEIEEAVNNQEVIEVLRYDALGNRLSSPAKGLNIVVFSDGSTKKILIP